MLIHLLLDISNGKWDFLWLIMFSVSMCLFCLQNSEFFMVMKDTFFWISVQMNSEVLKTFRPCGFSCQVRLVFRSRHCCQSDCVFIWLVMNLFNVLPKCLSDWWFFDYSLVWSRSFGTFFLDYHSTTPTFCMTRDK